MVSRSLVTVALLIIVFSCNNHNLVNRFKNNSDKIKEFAIFALDSSLCMSEFIYSIEKNDNFISVELMKLKLFDSIEGYNSIICKYNYISESFNLCDKKIETLNGYQKDYIRKTSLYFQEMEFDYVLINNGEIRLGDKKDSKYMIYFPLNHSSYQTTENYYFMETLTNNWYVIEYKYDLSL